MGTACVFRIGGCGADDDLVASPTELQDALRQTTPSAVPTVDLDFAAALDGGEQWQRWQHHLNRLLRAHVEAEVVLIRLTPPSARSGTRSGKDQARRIANELRPSLGNAVRIFQSTCPELTDRSKRHKRECTNVC